MTTQNHKLSYRQQRILFFTKYMLTVYLRVQTTVNAQRFKYFLQYILFQTFFCALFILDSFPLYQISQEIYRFRSNTSGKDFCMWYKNYDECARKFVLTQKAWNRAHCQTQKSYLPCHSSLSILLVYGYHNQGGEQISIRISKQ